MGFLLEVEAIDPAMRKQPEDSDGWKMRRMLSTFTLEEQKASLNRSN